MPSYRFHWFHGKASEGAGNTPEEAFTLLGYGGGAVAALDYWEQIEEPHGVSQAEQKQESRDA